MSLARPETGLLHGPEQSGDGAWALDIGPRRGIACEQDGCQFSGVHDVKHVERSVAGGPLNPAVFAATGLTI
jgi:hypothetical protein